VLQAEAAVAGQRLQAFHRHVCNETALLAMLRRILGASHT
jgi:hypothetical protein